MLSRQSKHIAKRFISASSATHEAHEKTSVLNNGMQVSSIELNGAKSSLVLAFRAGSRYQEANKQGLVHLIRNSIGRDSQEFAGLSLVWNTAVNGGQLSSASNRDILALKLDVVRDNVPVALSLLGQLGTNAFKPWDVEDVKNETLKADKSYMCLNAQTVELLHQAAFRNGPLSRSNYLLNNVSANDLSKFASERLVTGEAVLVGVNVDHDTLVNSASQQFPIPDGTGKVSEQNKYFGGEVRREGPVNKTFVAICGEGASLKSVKECAAQAVASNILLAAAQKVCRDAIPINLNYQDSGLVGVQFSSCNNTISSLTKSIVSGFKSVDASNISAAKKLTALQVLSNAQKSCNVALDRATQLLAGSEPVSAAEFAKIIEDVSAEDVKKVISRVNGKLSLAALGTPSLVPYLDEM